MNKIIQYLKDNVLIILPASVVALTLIGFIVFGSIKPTTYLVDQQTDILATQTTLEGLFLVEYEKGDYTKQDPYFILNPYEISPLSGLLMFETSEIEAFIITVKGKEESGDLTFNTVATESHKIPIYGLYPDYNNEIIVYENINGQKGVMVHRFYVQTDPLPEEATHEISITTTADYFKQDIMILMPAGKTFPIGVDYNGDVRWVLTRNFSWAPVLLQNGNLLLGTDRLMSDPYYVTGLYEISYLGKIYKEYKIPGGYHHDVVQKPNGNLLVLTNEFQGTVEDIIVEIDKNTGNIIETWDLKQFLYQTQGMAEMWTSYDWFHNNSIDYDPDTDSVIVSGRHQDIVVSFNLTNRKINYIIGDPNNFAAHLVDYFFLTPIGANFEWQYAQHSAIYTPEGIFLFDNGNNKSKYTENYVDAMDSYSRGVLYQIDEENRTIEQVFQFGKELGNMFYSPYISNVQYLGESHYMIHSGGHASANGEVLNIPVPLYDGNYNVILNSITYEVQNGIVVYHLEINEHYYRALHTSLYTSKTTFISGEAQVLGNLQETIQATDVSKSDFNFFETVPQKYNLQFIKETDRLVVKGTFDKDDTIYIAFKTEDETEVLYYHIPTSNTAYTAMCLGTFIEDSREIIYYINETNIEGRYELFLIVNGEEYNTYQHVVFD